MIKLSSLENIWKVSRRLGCLGRIWIWKWQCTYTNAVQRVIREKHLKFSRYFPLILKWGIQRVQYPDRNEDFSGQQLHWLLGGLVDWLIPRNHLFQKNYSDFPSFCPFLINNMAQKFIFTGFFLLFCLHFPIQYSFSGTINLKLISNEATNVCGKKERWKDDIVSLTDSIFLLQWI